MTDRGSYEKRMDGDEFVISGDCAACGQPVEERDGDDHFVWAVVRFSTDGTRGGIFHARCAPTGPQWFGVSEADTED